MCISYGGKINRSKRNKTKIKIIKILRNIKCLKTFKQKTYTHKAKQ